jgi:amylosucrase
MHRPPMDWAAAGRRDDPATLEGRVFDGLRRMGEVRRSLVALRGGTASELLDLGNDAVLAWRRRHPRGGDFVGVVNASPSVQAVDADTVTGFGTFRPVLASDVPLRVSEGRLQLPGLSYAWFAEP